MESTGNPDPMMAMSTQYCATWFEAGDFDNMLRWSQRVIDLADGDPVKGAGYGNGSPLALALVWRGMARYWLGLTPGIAGGQDPSQYRTFVLTR